MQLEDRKRFRLWSKNLNRDQFYVSGTAQETIQYTAGGSTIDWIYSVGVASSFVIEVIPPCADRWCSSLLSDDVWGAIERYGNTGYQFIQLVCNDCLEGSNNLPSVGGNVMVVISILSIANFLIALSFFIAGEIEDRILLNLAVMFVCFC